MERYESNLVHFKYQRSIRRLGNLSDIPVFLLSVSTIIEVLEYFNSLLDILNLAHTCKFFYFSVKGSNIKDMISHFVLQNIAKLGRQFNFNSAQLLPFLGRINGTISGSAALFMVRGIGNTFKPTDIDIYVQDSVLLNQLKTSPLNSIPESARFYISQIRRALRYDFCNQEQRRYQHTDEFGILNFSKTWRFGEHQKTKKIQLIVSEAPVEEVIQNFDFTIVKNAVSTARGKLLIGLTDFEAIRCNEVVIEDALFTYTRSSSYAAERTLKYLNRLNVEPREVKLKQMRYFY
jgi:hypothetical protein